MRTDKDHRVSTSFIFTRCFLFYQSYTPWTALVLDLFMLNLILVLLGHIYIDKGEEISDD